MIEQFILPKVQTYLVLSVITYHQACLLDGMLPCQYLERTSPGHWATLGNQRSGLPGELFHSRCSQHTVPLPGYKFRPWQSGVLEIHFLCPEKFTLGQCRIRTTNLLICSRYYWTKVAHDIPELILYPRNCISENQ